MTQAFQPANTLYSRTFIALLIAQFLAAFNDQAIHSSAMFFAINKSALNEAQAISLMPLLFYAPWAIFCSIAGYLADRFSKQSSLIFWKIAEVFITAIALLGFWLGTQDFDQGPWIVLSTVFLMGMHSAFFVPAKYGVMPEILRSHLLSKGNGLLESLSFLAVIMGTVFGGILSYEFKGQEYWIGVVLLVLASIGAIASLWIERMPPANPNRQFPPYLYQPVWQNLKQIFTSKPLAFAVTGLAFFTFIAAFSRASIYILGESQMPRWTELKTSAIVGMTALGVGFGSPLVGYLSGGKIEVGLIPIGIVGMIIGGIFQAFFIDQVSILIVFIIFSGFFTGFYVVPLFTLLQHRAPKASKGDVVATSNLINVTGAILASLVFLLVVKVAHFSGTCPQINMTEIGRGKINTLEIEHGRPIKYSIEIANKGEPTSIRLVENSPTIVIDNFSEDIAKGSMVIEKSYTLNNVEHKKLYESTEVQHPVFDNHYLPRYLLLVAAFITFIAIVFLRYRMPDLFLRTLLWGYFFPKYSLRAHGLHNLTSHGPVLLVHEGNSLEDAFLILSATDRTPRTLFNTNADQPEMPNIIKMFANKHSLGWLKQLSISENDIEKIIAKIRRNFLNSHAVSIGLNGPWTERVLQIVNEIGVPVIPVNISRTRSALSKAENIVYVNFGDEVTNIINKETLVKACKQTESPEINEETPTV